jgi:6-phosphogluconolactonase/glucosamine-6-phosphate isomerase/deaminase
MDIHSFVSQLSSLLGDQTKPVLFLYSGGSSLTVLEHLSVLLASSSLSHVVMAPVDERRDRLHSNVASFRDSEFFERYVQAGVVCIDVGDLSLSINDLADRYDQQIKTLCDDISSHDGAIVSLLGMGNDGHTAGIFPFPENPDYFASTFIDTERFVVGYDVGGKSEYRERITLTFPALQQADHTFVYVTGENKRAAFSSSQSDGPESIVPARLWKHLRNVYLYTDIVIG